MDDAWKREFARKTGWRLRAARKRQGDLAAVSGVSVGRLKQYEAGVGRITVRELEQLAAALRLPVSYFLEACILCRNN
jgi:transcriptional regulator with XRE-family HTH domain